MKDITISNEVGGVFATGLYENERHRISWSITYHNTDWELDDIQKRTDEITERLYADLERREQHSNFKAIEKQYKDIRWYESETGEKYPSVTSVIDAINPITWHVNSAQRRGLAARGQVGDIILQKYIETGEWSEPEKIPEAYRHLRVMKTEGYQLEGNLPAFVEKYKVKFKQGHFRVVNDEHKYAGTPDCECFFGDGILTLADLKWFNPDKDGLVRCMKQLAAYAMASGTKYEKLAIIPINGKTKQGFSQPIFTTEIDKYFTMFLEDRRAFEELFGI